MTDPLSIVLAAAAAGGAAGKLAEKSLDFAGQWIAEAYSSHSENAKIRARENATDFLNQLGGHLQDLESKGLVTPEQVSEALESPAFSMGLHHALLSAAQTSLPEKRDYLASLISDQMVSNEDTTEFLAAKSACNIISQISSNQLNILGIILFAKHLHRGYASPEDFMEAFPKELASFGEYSCKSSDWQHLAAHGCLSKNSFFATPLGNIFQKKMPSVSEFNMQNSPEFARLKEAWPNLESLELTSVGVLIGSKVVTQKLKIRIDLSSWLA